MRKAAALAALTLGLVPAASGANPSLTDDFRGMSQWLSHELAQGLAFNAGSNFDPPHEVKGYYLQPDLSLGLGRMPLDKRDFPVITTPALNDFGGQNLFPDSVIFPNLALHLRMGLPWRGDAYFRFADATTPSGYKISKTMTAAVQTNSYGFGVRQHFFGREEQPTLTLGAHYNHVRGRVRLKGKFLVDVPPGFTADSQLDGALDWNLNSYGLTALVHKEYGPWVPFGGIGYNYATGSVRARLELRSETPLIQDVIAEGSDHPEQNQGRWIFGFEYKKPTWSFFANAELKALGRVQYRSFIAQAGFALPYEIGRGPAVIYKKRSDAASSTYRPREDDEPAPRPSTTTPRRQNAPKREEAAPEMIFIR